LKATALTANDLTRAILLAIPQRFPARAWRRNVGGGYPAQVVHQALTLLDAGRVKDAIALLRRTRVVHYGMAGEPDIDGIIQVPGGHGLRLAIEVKAGSDRVREDQANYGAMVERFGGVYLVARDVEEVLVELAERLTRA
jgi:hypothetical protein